MTDRETRQFGVSVDDVTAIDCWVETVGARWSVGEQTVFNTRLCLAELAANVLEHGRPGAVPDRMVVTLSRIDDGIGIEFLDTRAAFDPTAVGSSIKSASTPGGHGLRLLHSFARDLRYSHDGRYNRVTLTIRPA